jgi:hypothetical protein
MNVLFAARGFYHLLQSELDREQSIDRGCRDGQTEIAMTASIMLYNPTAVRAAGAETAQHTLADLKGKVVGFIDNAKPNFDYLVDDLAALLVSRYGVARVIKRKKRAASVPADELVYTELAEQCDLVITGSGD